LDITDRLIGYAIHPNILLSNELIYGVRWIWLIEEWTTRFEVFLI